MSAGEGRAAVPPDQLKLGLVLPTWTTTDLHWTDVLDMARVAEEVGFDSLYATDHLLLPGTNEELRRRAGAAARKDGVAEPEGYLECFTVLTALAVAVPRVRIGALVACTGYRNPALMAKVAATLDDICGGRLVLGLGAGDSSGEHHTFGYPADHPVSRFEEAVQIIRGLFDNEELDYEGTYYQVRQARLVPRPVRTGGPPILIGTLNPRPRMRCMVARYAHIWNGWLGYTDATPESAERQLRIIDEACREHGRDPLTLVATTAVRAAIPGSGYTPAPDERPLQGGPREMAETLRGHARLGITEVQVALTMSGSDGVRAFAPVIAELRSGRAGG